MTGPLKPEDGPIRAEIQFFMDKIFQSSLAYFILLVSTLAISKTSLSTDLAVQFSMSPGDLVACALLLLNVLYATLSCSCMFAVLKRGLFALAERDRVSDTWRKWEVFVRDDTHSHGHINMNSLSWNIDNYYVVPLFLGVIVVSGVSFWQCISGGSSAAIVVASLLAAVHLVPLEIIRQLGRLNAICHRLARQP